MSKRGGEAMIGLEYIVKEFHLEYKALAENLGVSPQTIQDWLKGRRNIPEKRLKQLSQFFNLPRIYFQKELTFIEKSEIRIKFLESISEESTDTFDEEGEVITYHHVSSYENEMKILRETIETKERHHKLKNEIERVIKKEFLHLNDVEAEINSPLNTNFSDIKALLSMIDILKDDNLNHYLKVIMYMLSANTEFGGKPEAQVASAYKAFAKDFLELLEKHRLPK